MHPVHHGSLGPTQGFSHGPETHLTAGEKMGVAAESIIGRKHFKVPQFGTVSSNVVINHEESLHPTVTGHIIFYHLVGCFCCFLVI